MSRSHPLRSRHHAPGLTIPNTPTGFWRVLANLDAVFSQFRAGFIGKSSPVHFFWGSFDFCVTRFSGRRAPERPGADSITREAYSHEVITRGFWPGSGKSPAPRSMPTPRRPQRFPEATVRPTSAYYDKDLSEFILMYDSVRAASDPAATLLAFLQSTYESRRQPGQLGPQKTWRKKPISRRARFSRISLFAREEKSATLRPRLRFQKLT